MAKIFIIISFLSIHIFSPLPTYGSATEVCVNALDVSMAKCKKWCGEHLSCQKACSWDESQIVAKCSEIPSHDKKHKVKEYCMARVKELYKECATACREEESCVYACDVGKKAGHKYCKG